MVTKQRKSVGWLVVALVLVLVVSGLVHALNLPGMGKCEKVKAVNGVVSIPLDKVSDGKAHFYKISEGGKEIQFFLVKGTDGSIKTAFDSCDVCYKEKKGYEQQGDAMLCKNCNKKFAIAKMGPNSMGGCNPSFLPHRESGGNVMISVDDLKAGAKYF
jgi:uncharacterized membrane protein